MQLSPSKWFPHVFLLLPCRRSFYLPSLFLPPLGVQPQQHFFFLCCPDERLHGPAPRRFGFQKFLAKTSNVAIWNAGRAPASSVLDCNLVVIGDKLARSPLLRPSSNIQKKLYVAPLSLSLHFDLIRLCGTQLKTNEHKKTKSLRYTAELIRWTPISIRSASVFRFLWNNPSLIFLTSTLLCTKQLGTRVKLLIQAINQKGKCWYWNTAGENEAIGLDVCSCCCWK